MRMDLSADRSVVADLYDGLTALVGLYVVVYLGVHAARSGFRAAGDNSEADR